MPVPHTLSPSHTRGSSRNSLFDSTPRYSLAPETTGRPVIESDAHETRKRSRYGDDTAVNPWNVGALLSSRSTDTKSPPPLANDRYELAGGMDRPHTFTTRDGDCDDYFNLQAQRGTWAVPAPPQVGLATQAAAGEMHTTPNGSKAWSLFSLVGGVAGKLFEFCTVPFRGFQAGGGQKFDADSQEKVAAKLGLQDDPYQPGPVQQPTPGFYPSDDYGIQSIESIPPEPPRLAKRLRTADNWVMVGANCETNSMPNTPRLSERRLPPGHGRSPSQIPRPVSRANPATPSQKRPSLIPVSRRSTTERRPFHSSTKVSPGSHTRARSYHRQSFGSPVAFEMGTNNTTASSPLFASESQRLIDRVRREEYEEDERLRRMSLQMTAMLKEANEALGSKFEVEMVDDDDLDDRRT
ncbi:hypothetical protein ACJQWK_01220 [Exserohilum turcicum]